MCLSGREQTWLEGERAGSEEPGDGRRGCGSPRATSVMEMHVGTIRSMCSRGWLFATARNGLFTVDLIFPCYKMEWYKEEPVALR